MCLSLRSVYVAFTTAVHFVFQRDAVFDQFTDVCGQPQEVWHSLIRPQWLELEVPQAWVASAQRGMMPEIVLVGTGWDRSGGLPQAVVG